jgi:hypothetical protein
MVKLRTFETLQFDDQFDGIFIKREFAWSAGGKDGRNRDGSPYAWYGLALLGGDLSGLLPAPPAAMHRCTATLHECYRAKQICAFRRELPCCFTHPSSPFTPFLKILPWPLLSLSLSHTHTLSLSHTHTRTHTHTLYLSLALSRPLSLSLSPRHHPKRSRVRTASNACACDLLQGLGFRVWGLGFRVGGFGIWV